MSEILRRHEAYMRQALTLAEQAAEEGEVPVGCIIVRNDEVIGYGRNSVQVNADPTNHAELLAIREALQQVDGKYLDGATLYVTLEPCAMCAGAILLTKIETVVYGASEPKSGAARSVFEILDNSHTNHQCVVRAGILEAECAGVMSSFFEAQRKLEKPVVQQTTRAVSPPERSGTSAGSLVLVPTPIGNMSDITRRSIEHLVNADAVYCEDTRHTGLLLKKLGITAKQLLSNHEHNETHRANEIVHRIQQGQTIVIVSDAGMPGISDPGYRAVVACAAAGLRVTALPGPSAAVTALAASGLPTSAWYFAGFPPQKKGRLTFIRGIVLRHETVVMYESPHRIGKLLDELLEHAGPERRVVVARELSKLHEEYLRGTVAEVVAVIQQRDGLKGECVVVLEGAAE